MRKVLLEYIKEAIERNEKTKDVFYKEKLKWRPVKVLANRMGISNYEALLFTHAYHLTLMSGSFSTSQIRDLITNDTFDQLEILELLNNLVEKELIIKMKSHLDFEYRVPEKILLEMRNKCKKDTRIFEVKKNLLTLSDELTGIFLMKKEQMIATDVFYKELDDFVAKNPEYKPLVLLRQNNVHQKEWVLFLVTFLSHLNGEQNANLDKVVRNFYSGFSNIYTLKASVSEKKADIVKKGLIEFEGTNFQSNNLIRVPQKIMKSLLGEQFDVVMSNLLDPSIINDLIYPASINSKKLYYNPREHREIKTIEKVLSPEKYNVLLAELKKSGFATGICMLFHGQPGTGKTESVYQLAKKSNRPILKVDISNIRDKFVGESEKNVKAIFHRYESIRVQSERDPILLFNEADAILNKRISAKDSVSQMNNALQNIILDAMENFNGILIATTNLIPSLDKAFERRFLYKIKFLQPQETVRKEIWSQHLPSLQSEDILKVAKEYNLSGGQIENVVKKIKLDGILNNKEMDINDIIHFCKEEFINATNSNGNKIGFKH